LSGIPSTFVLTALFKQTQRKAWEISERSEEERTQVQALSLARDCVINKLDLLTNATVVNDAMKLVTDYSNNNNNKKLISKEEDNSRV